MATASEPLEFAEIIIAQQVHHISEQRLKIRLLESELSSAKERLIELETKLEVQNTTPGSPEGKEARVPSTVANPHSDEFNATGLDGTAAHRAGGGKGVMGGRRTSKARGDTDKQDNKERNASKTEALKTPALSHSERAAAASGIAPARAHAPTTIGPQPPSGSSDATGCEEGLHVDTAKPPKDRQDQRRQSTADGSTTYKSRPQETIEALNDEKTRWVALRCPFGGGNASRDTKQFFKGLRGLRTHAAQAHPVSMEELPNTAQAFLTKYRDGGDELTEAEVLKIRQRAPDARIIVRTYCPEFGPTQKPATKVPASTTDPKTSKPPSQAKNAGQPESSRDGPVKRAHSGGGDPGSKRRGSVLDDAADGDHIKHEVTCSDDGICTVATPRTQVFHGWQNVSPPAPLCTQRADSVTSKHLRKQSKLSECCMMLATTAILGDAGERTVEDASKEVSGTPIGPLPVSSRDAVEAPSFDAGAEGQ